MYINLNPSVDAARLYVAMPPTFAGAVVPDSVLYSDSPALAVTAAVVDVSDIKFSRASAKEVLA